MPDRSKLLNYLAYAAATAAVLALNALLTRWLGRPVEIPPPPAVVLQLPDGAVGLKGGPPCRCFP